jgi:putative ABC transport system ATP-binding protein
MIELRNVTKTHPSGETEVRALRGISATVDRGSFNFVVGPSGSGKSTLLYLLGALDEPTAGEVLVDGRSLASLSNRERDRYRRERVGFVFQSFNLLRNLTALENVLVPFLPRGANPETRRRAIELLDRVGLADRKTHRPSQLSGGEQQRVAIARALLKQPQLVLADEPTGELDSTTGREVFAHLRNVHRDRDTTVVVVTHDPAHIVPGDRRLVVRDGLVVEDEIVAEQAAIP